MSRIIRKESMYGPYRNTPITSMYLLLPLSRCWQSISLY